MTQEKILARQSNGWYIWAAAASAAMIIADMVLHGVTSLNIPPAVLSMAFAYFTFSGKRVEDRVIARYQERPPPVGMTTTMTLAMRARDPPLARKIPLRYVGCATGVLPRVFAGWRSKLEPGVYRRNDRIPFRDDSTKSLYRCYPLQIETSHG
jgi:hypothetical protein